MQETARVLLLGQEDPLKEGMATHSSVLAWRIPWTEEPSRLQSIGLQRVGHDLVTKTKTTTSEVEHLFIGSFILGGTEQESSQWIIKRQISQGSLAWVQGALLVQGD